tara:strand:- start:724 stop:930 length:207 start_codon:yes stop_codon:yes gene_type:complete
MVFSPPPLGNYFQIKFTFILIHPPSSSIHPPSSPSETLLAVRGGFYGRGAEKCFWSLLGHSDDGKESF